MNPHDASRARDGLDDAERESLRCLVAEIVPASADPAMPGADDPTIFADILASLDRDADGVRAALHRLDALSGGRFAAQEPSARRSSAQRLREAEPAHASVLAAVTLRCYYRDDRVMRAIGMDVRPPYPKGFEVAQGDWSLLEPVRARGRIWRDAP